MAAMLSMLIRAAMPCRTHGHTGLLGAASTLTSRIVGDQVYELPTSATINQSPSMINYLQTRGAARKGKRIRRAIEARANASKRRLLQAQNPKTKKTFKREVKLDRDQFRFLNERQLDLSLPPPPADNVFFRDKFKSQRFSLEEALEFHRQVAHPDVLNQPSALLSATIELNLKMKIKKKKYIESIATTVSFPNVFKYNLAQRKIVALSKSPDDQEKARLAGAIITGGMDIVQLFKTKQLTQRDFDHVVCQTDFLADFASIKGMKGLPFFPSKQRGNFGDDIESLVKYFKDGVDYKLKKNDGEPEYGFIDCYIGTLDMTDQQLRDNLLALFQSIGRFKPLNLADGKQFVERVALTTPVSKEVFLIKFWELTDEYQDPHAEIDDDEETILTEVIKN